MTRIHFARNRLHACGRSACRGAGFARRGVGAGRSAPAASSTICSIAATERSDSSSHSSSRGRRKWRRPTAAIASCGSTASRMRCASSPAPSSNCSIRIRCSKCSSSACRTTPNTASSNWGQRRPRRRAPRRIGAAWRAAPAAPGQRSDVFDPRSIPTAPGVPRTLGDDDGDRRRRRTDRGPGRRAGRPRGRRAARSVDARRSAAAPPAPARAVDGAPVPAQPPSDELPPPPPRNTGAPAHSRRCRRRPRRRTNTSSPTATCCTRTMRWPNRPSAISCANIRTSAGAGRAILAGRKPVPAAALSRRRGILPGGLDQIRAPARRPIRCCGSASRSPRCIRRKRPAPPSPRSGANIRAPRQREARRGAGTKACALLADPEKHALGLIGVGSGSCPLKSRAGFRVGSQIAFLRSRSFARAGARGLRRTGFDRADGACGALAQCAQEHGRS